LRIDLWGLNGYLLRVDAEANHCFLST